MAPSAGAFCRLGQTKEIANPAGFPATDPNRRPATDAVRRLFNFRQAAASKPCASRTVITKQHDPIRVLCVICG